MFAKKIFSSFANFFIPLFLPFVIYSSELHLSISSHPARLNPILATDSASSTISSYLFDGLLKYDKNGKIVGDLAEKFYFEEDNITLFFKLKENLTWQDGAPITSQDILFTYETAISSKIFSPYSSSFRMVKNIEIIDQYSVKIFHKQPYFKALETWLMPLIPKHILENEKDLMTSSFNNTPIGNSFFVLKNLELGKDITLFANENYYIHKPYIDKIYLHYVQDPSTEFLMLKSKKLDIGSLTPIQIERQIDNSFKDFYNIIETPDFAYTYLGFNLKREKFQDKRVREAISYALDKDELVDILFFGHGKAANGPFLEGSLGFNKNITTQKQNIKKAKELLKSAGYDEKNQFTFEITTNSNNPIRMNAIEIIQHQLKKSGIVVKIKALEWQAFLNRVVHARNFDSVLLGWSTSLMPDPYNIWHKDSDKKGGFNFIGYDNNKVNTLIEKAQSTIDRKDLDLIFQEIFKEIVLDYPYIFLYIPNSITVINKKITPIEPTFLGIDHNRLEWQIQP